MNKLAILGAGSWGLTLAWLAADQQPNVWLWDRNPEKIEVMKQDRNVRFPVPVILPNRLNLTHSLTEAVEGADVILLSVTVNGTRDVLRRLREEAGLKPSVILVNTSKGGRMPRKSLCGAVRPHVGAGNPERPPHRLLHCLQG
jgi:glycerol-3-phosphate dehydrogenase (NAD(P)+)